VQDLEDRGGQPGRSSKHRNGCGAAVSAVLASTVITRGRTSPANASSAARPKKKTAPKPPALPPIAEAPGTGIGVPAGLGLGTLEGTRCGTAVRRGEASVRCFHCHRAAAGRRQVALARVGTRAGALARWRGAFT
jgi:hypothetical protein